MIAPAIGWVGSALSFVSEIMNHVQRVWDRVFTAFLIAWPLVSMLLIAVLFDEVNFQRRQTKKLMNVLAVSYGHDNWESMEKHMREYRSTKVQP